jgi:polyisoprenoid-binding protein YceI
MLGKLLSASLVLLGFAVVPLAAPQKAGGGGADGAFKIDPVHSTVLFKIRHMGVSNFRGRFNEANGTVTIDAAKPTASTIHFSIPAAKIDTNNADRDKHLRGTDFFNADEFATINFDSTKVEPKGKDELEVTGDLSLHGVKKSITVHVKQIGYADIPKAGVRVGFEASFQIRRSDFGMKSASDLGMLGDEVDLIVNVEAAK